MGWAAGSSLLMEVWGRVRGFVPDESRSVVLYDLMKVFSREDCDTLDEVVCSKWPESEIAFEKFMRSSK